MSDTVTKEREAAEERFCRAVIEHVGRDTTALAEVLRAHQDVAAAVRAEERARLEEGLVGFRRIAFVSGAKWGATDRGMAQAHAEAVKRYPLAALTGADK